MLAVIAYLGEVGEATIADLSHRFGLAPERMRRELELVAMCGLPPYLHGELIDLIVYDDRVQATIPEYLVRPQRLSRAEGFAVLAACRAMVEVHGPHHEALEGAAEKLARTLGVDSAQVGIVVEDPDALDDVRRATDESETLHLTYFSAWRDTVSDRLVDPLRVSFVEGDWYLDAFDHDHAEVRKFKISRIRAVEGTGETFDRSGELSPPSSFDRPADAVPVRVLIPASASWAPEVYPGSATTEHDDGSLEMEIHVVGTTWLERLMMRAGPSAEILEPAALRDLPATTASRLLDRYDASR